MRYLKALLLAIVGLYFAVFIAAFAEFQIWIHAEKYPLWLATPLVIKHYPPSMTDGGLFEYVDKVCGPERGMIAFTDKTNGHFVRCDHALSATAWWHGVYRLIPE
ncbi:hypothetical protein I7V28_19590 [Lelliottia amnigena]|uniref:hypothetical protein n=1 Tax=Lelliottia TaxID=1330545 RepID=UPI00192B6E21|nr:MULTISPECIES: hypothetical protein [Lelliottia]MBL5885707.1 hypothetical protein [Lelliottia aquatilis]MBL5923286.1 hypothetical protein [Lelliottia amnigena]MBL5932195.1 hypothetical protein [Lelliottia amnigena]